MGKLNIIPVNAGTMMAFNFSKGGYAEVDLDAGDLSNILHALLPEIKRLSNTERRKVINAVFSKRSIVIRMKAYIGGYRVELYPVPEVFSTKSKRRRK